MFLSKAKKRPPEMTSSSGETLQEILGLQTGDCKSHSLAVVTIPPGKSSSAHYHKDSDESYLILSGQARLTLDKKDYELDAGDACLIQPQEVHQIFNESDQELIFLAVCIPAWHPDDSFDITDSEI